MKINAIVYTPVFRANVGEKVDGERVVYYSNPHISAAPPIPMESEFLKTLRSGGRLSPDAVDENGNTMFHLFVKNNYTTLLSHMISRGYDFKDVINRESSDGVFPLDVATSLEMKIVLQRLGGVSVKDAPKAAPVPTQTATEDARVIAARQYMSQTVMDKTMEKAREAEVQPVPDKIAEKAREAETQPVPDKAVEKSSDIVPVVNETQPAAISFFNSIEEVPDYDETSLPVLQSSDNEVQTTSSSENSPEKPGPKELNLEGLTDFKRLEITESDVLHIDDLIGQSDVKSELKQNVVIPLTDKNISETLKDNQIDLPNGLLLIGNGSTLTTVKALSNDAEIPVVIIENPRELPQIRTAVEARYKKTGLRTAILAQGFDKWWSQCTTCDEASANTFKNNLRGIKNKGGLFIGTTTNKQFVNSDFIQSGIIDKVLELARPGKDDRFLFLYKYLSERKIFGDIFNEEDIVKIVDLTDGLYFSDIKRILNETARTAMANNVNANMDIFASQLEDFSTETGRVPITEENRTAAYDTEFKRIPVKKGEIMGFDKLGGMHEIKEQLNELYIAPMKDIDEAIKILGDDAIPDGAIFYGPPRNGKTYIAKILARELGLPFYEIRMSEFATSEVHESSKPFKRLIEQLEKKFKETGERSVLFLDEFDAIGSTREGNGQGDKELTTTLLQELNNPAERGIIVIAATNYIQNVDPALRERGRLGNLIKFENPNFVERKELIKNEFLKSEFTKKYAEKEDLISKVATETDGFPRGVIVHIIKDAKLGSYKKQAEFEQAITKAIDKNAKRAMADFCGKAGLSQHTYSANAFQSLDDLGGMDDVKKQLEEHIINVWNPEVIKIYKENKMDLPGGVMLEGPPGTGKTTIIETLARQMGIPLFKMDYSKISDSSYIHAISRHVAEIFEQLKLQSKILKKPVMLFFDEAEKFFPQIAREKHDVEEVNTYKELMNTASESGIIMIGATNHIEKVNQEIIGNPRRMGTVIHVGNPDDKSRQSLFEKTRDTKPIFAGALTAGVISELVYLTRGLSTGDIMDKIKKLFAQAVIHKQPIDEEAILKTFTKMPV